MKIAVVIPALEEAERIQAAIASARAPGVEVVVVDGGSRDGTRERARLAGIRVIDSEPGRAVQLARGVRETDADVVVFLHADTRLPAGFADAIRAALVEPGVVAGAFRFGFAEPGALLRFVEWGARLRGAWLGLPYGDQALFVRRRVLNAVGGVPQAPIMEDLDLVRALRRCGRLVLLPEVALTSARRYQRRGVLRSMLRNWAAASAWALGVSRARIAAWYRR